MTLIDHLRWHRLFITSFPIIPLSLPCGSLNSFEDWNNIWGIDQYAQTDENGAVSWANIHLRQVPATKKT
jgi:hypothetical protein